MQPNVQLRRLEAGDVDPIVAAFDALGWDKPRRQYERYLAEQAEGRRVVLVAVEGGRILRYGNVVWESGYPPFREDGVPEIQDLNVFPEFRRRGVASLILDEAERLVRERSPVVGIGFGLYADYGTAQRLYAEGAPQSASSAAIAAPGRARATYHAPSVNVVVAVTWPRSSRNSSVIPPSATLRQPRKRVVGRRANTVAPKVYLHIV